MESYEELGDGSTVIDNGHMPDVVDPATRSRMMSGIRGKNTRPEITVRRLLHHRGFRYRLNVTSLPGKPDIVLPRFRAVILVNGCFWHWHDCHLFKWPSTRPEWWRAKLMRTRDVDQANLTALQAAGWRVAIVWECGLKGRERLEPEDVADQLERWLRSGEQTRLEIRGVPQ